METAPKPNSLNLTRSKAAVVGWSLVEVGNQPQLVNKAT